MKTISLKDFTIGADKLTIFAGPCVIEDEKIMFETAEKLKEITLKLNINYVYKASYDKANRSSITSYRGVGLEAGLKLLQKIKKEFDVPIVTDFHLPQEAKPVSEIADILQIPAFLCRQTDMLVAAGKTGKIVNIKKGQFLAPNQMFPLAKKVESSGNDKILFTDRGVSFGYNNLISDMRGIKIMQDGGYPVIFDATHSVQIPGGLGDKTGGERQFVPLLARAAIASGAKGLFFEVHPNPDCALCDGPNQLAIKDAKKVFKICKEIFEIVNK